MPSERMPNQISWIIHTWTWKKCPISSNIRCARWCESASDIPAWKKGARHVCQTINQPINQSINQSTNQPTNQSTNQSINQRIDHSINERLANYGTVTFNPTYEVHGQSHRKIEGIMGRFVFYNNVVTLTGELAKLQGLIRSRCHHVETLAGDCPHDHLEWSRITLNNTENDSCVYTVSVVRTSCNNSRSFT